MNKKILISAAVFGLFAVLLGAFGAHGLKPLIASDAMTSFDTGVRYQMIHALVLLILGITSYVSKDYKKACYYLIVIGVILFSGSIYGLSTNTLTSFDFRTIAFVTPIGGVLLISAWLVLLINFLKLTPDKLEN